MTEEAPFWERKGLAEMSAAEWESLCDGCGKCCLHKLEDEDSGEVFYTRLACNELNVDTCRCRHYAQRLERVPECISLRPEDVETFRWLPSSCSYRLVAEGKALPAWHHLLSESPSSVHESSASVRAWAINARHIHPSEWEEQIVRWLN